MPLTKKTLPKILVTGATGLVGSRFIELCSNIFSITTIGRSKVDININLLSAQEVNKFVQKSDAEAVVNFAAYTNVDEAQRQKRDKTGDVYILNVLLPFWLAKSCKTSGKKLCHISTDYVFNGKSDDRPYKEGDIPSPVDSWYSITKALGEEKVSEGTKGEQYSIVRISYPYSGVYTRKLDFARAIIEKLHKNEPFWAITDQKIKPTSVDDVAKAVSLLLNKGLDGIYHVAGNYSPKDYITPYQFALKLADFLDFDPTLIKPISFSELSKKRVAPRPQHTWLNTSKIELQGFKFTPFEDALKRFKLQLG